VYAFQALQWPQAIQTVLLVATADREEETTTSEGDCLV
jgi:hypothetical protein